MEKTALDSCSMCLLSEFLTNTPQAFMSLLWKTNRTTSVCALFELPLVTSTSVSQIMTYAQIDLYQHTAFWNPGHCPLMTVP